MLKLHFGDVKQAFTTFQVYVEHGFGDETFTTKMAHVRFFPRVAPHVNYQTASLRKTFGAIIANVGFFPCVHPHVFHQNRFFGKALSAVLTAKNVFFFLNIWYDIIKSTHL